MTAILSYVGVACGGALGAVSRLLTTTASRALFTTQFPIGTLFVNCLGAFLIGLFMSLFVERMMFSESIRLFIVVGFLGGYTTFSSFTWETWALYNNGQWLTALGNILLTNLLTLLLTFIGIQLGRGIA